jgi:hypothetical protein
MGTYSDHHSIREQEQLDLVAERWLRRHLPDISFGHKRERTHDFFIIGLVICVSCVTITITIPTSAIAPISISITVSITAIASIGISTIPARSSITSAIAVTARSLINIIRFIYVRSITSTIGISPSSIIGLATISSTSITSSRSTITASSTSITASGSIITSILTSSITSGVNRSRSGGVGYTGASACAASIVVVTEITAKVGPAEPISTISEPLSFYLSFGFFMMASLVLIVSIMAFSRNGDLLDC